MYHPEAFKQLDSLNLGHRPLCIQEMLENHHNLDQCSPSLTEIYKELEEILAEINSHLSTQSLTSHSSASTSTQFSLSCFSLTCLRPQAINLGATFNQYQKNMVHALFNYYTARKRRYLGRYFAHPMMQNRRAKRDDYKPSAALVTGHYVP
ncbi:hypothetical protein A0O36_01748 [Piscirickettsiaceae bacterium NZ-RLO1]|nr:hypothetical protein A0O36_01748 [Piscirickettsiaceae bacterium NZ-RLO1]